MSRPSFEEIYMSFAETIAKRSSCKRLQVGSVITTTDYRKVLAVGYNGNAAGLPNTCDSDTPGACGCIHSECNCLINLDTSREVEKHLFVTHSPCPNCAKLIINAGNIKKVFYKNKYRVTLGLELLEQTGIEVIHLTGENNNE